MDNEQITAIYQFGGVLGIVLAGGVFAFRWVTAEVAKLGQPATKVDTKIYTTDSTAMGILAGSIEALNMSVIETNKMLRDAVRQHEIDEEVERRVRQLRANPEK